jgi:hypothetical protein
MEGSGCRPHHTGDSPGPDRLDSRLDLRTSEYRNTRLSLRLRWGGWGGPTNGACTPRQRDHAPGSRDLSLLPPPSFVGRRNLPPASGRTVGVAPCKTQSKDHQPDRTRLLYPSSNNRRHPLCRGDTRGVAPPCNSQVAKKRDKSRKIAEWGFGRLLTRRWPSHFLENATATWGFACGQHVCKSSTALILAVLTAPEDRPILAGLTQRKHPAFPVMTS